MGVFERLLKRKDTEPSMAVPEDLMGMGNSLNGTGSYGGSIGYPDPLSMSNPQIGPYKDNIDMVGLASITIDNDDVIEKFRSKLRGYAIKKRYNNHTQKQEEEIIKFGEPFCNDDGINEITGDLELLCSKIITLGNIPKSKESMIPKLIRNVSFSVSTKIVMNNLKWNVDRTRRSTVMDLFRTIAWTNMMRGYDDGERIKLYQSQKQTINTTLMGNAQQPEKKSLFG